MTQESAPLAILSLDVATRALVRLAARIAGGTELEVRDALRDVQEADAAPLWVEELILQSYLFCGFPRTLNAAREWRRTVAGSGAPAPASGDAVTAPGIERDFRAEGEATCARVYGKFYEKLRQNIVALHPELDAWMILEGYGKVLSRPGLDLGRRELCIVAACVASGQDRQLHSHLHGCRNVGVPDAVVQAALDALEGAVDGAALDRAGLLWKKVRGQGA